MEGLRIANHSLDLTRADAGSDGPDPHKTLQPIRAKELEDDTDRTRTEYRIDTMKPAGY